MRCFTTAVAMCGAFVATSDVQAQQVRTQRYRTPGGQVIQQRTVTPARPSAPVIDHGHHHGGGGHYHGGGLRGGYGGAYWDGYGFPNYGVSGFSYGVPGYGFNYYSGPSNWGPLINPPIYAFGPYSSWPGYGPVGYGLGYYPGYYVDPINNQYLQQQYNNDWTILSARLADLATRNVAEPTAGATAVPIPSTPELMIKSLRFQAQGDEAFAKQDYQRAYDRYKQATLTAKDNGSAQIRMGYTLVAIGQYSRAIEYFKRGLFVDPALAITGPAPSELYGDNNLAWASHLSKVTEWVREDIRDYERVFLLGTLLFFDGDTRARELLEKAYQLSGGREQAVVTLLNPPKLENVKDVTPADDNSVPADEDASVAPADEGPSLETPAEDGATDAEPLIPEPPSAETPSAETSPTTRPAGQEPLFPLPSQRTTPPAESAVPPLPEE